VTENALGVLVMAYGTPKSQDEVLPYYTHIRHGHPPTLELLQQLLDRYQAIGGLSPLNEITQAQARGIEAALNQDGGRPIKVYLGFKHTSPFISDSVHQMAADGITQVVTLVLAPHYSTMSVAAYQTAANETAAETGLTLWHVNDWHLQPRFLEVVAERVERALAKTPNPDTATVLFSAHSLPERILEAGDPYPQQLRETGEAIAAKLDLNHFGFAWQSAGRTNDKWLGPDILDELRRLAAKKVNQVVVCPVGFVADHLEVLYDIDVECKHLARDLGLHLTRTDSLNADPGFLQALAEIIRARESLAKRGHL